MCGKSEKRLPFGEIKICLLRQEVIHGLQATLGCMAKKKTERAVMRVTSWENEKYLFMHFYTVKTNIKSRERERERERGR